MVYPAKTITQLEVTGNILICSDMYLNLGSCKDRELSVYNHSGYKVCYTDSSANMSAV